MYSSSPDDKIFQDHPVWSIPSQFKAKSWCDTVEGYLHEAKKLTMLLIRNRQLMRSPYRWFVTIYVDFCQSPSEISAWWIKAKRNLARRGVDALWVREPTRSNKVHYHLLVTSQHSAVDLAKIIEESLPPRSAGRWHKNIKPVGQNDWRLLHYITKAKFGGMTKAGVYLPDLYLKKRLMFKKKLKIRKLGTIGSFWFKKKTGLWQEIVEHEKQISEGLKKPVIKKVARYVYDFIGGAVPLKRIERSFGYYSESEGVQSWIDRMLEDEIIGENEK